MYTFVYRTFINFILFCRGQAPDAQIEKGTKTASIDLLIEIAVYGWVTLDYLILRQSLAAVQVKENIRMMREALNVLEQSL